MNLLKGGETIETSVLKDNYKRARLAINVFWGICLVNLLAVISGYMELELLQNLSLGVVPADEVLAASDTRQMVIGLLQTGLYLASIILFLNWFRRAYGNLHRMQVVAPEHQETMAVWSFVIPFINLYRPYQIAKEIITGIQMKLKAVVTDYRPANNLGVLGVWWALFILTNYIGQFAFKTVFKDDTIEQLITSSQAYMVSDLLDIPAAILTLLIIQKISKDEVLLFNRLS